MVTNGEGSALLPICTRLFARPISPASADSVLVGLCTPTQWPRSVLFRQLVPLGADEASAHFCCLHWRSVRAHCLLINEFITTLGAAAPVVATTVWHHCSSAPCYVTLPVTSLADSFAQSVVPYALSGAQHPPMFTWHPFVATFAHVL